MARPTGDSGNVKFGFQEFLKSSLDITITVSFRICICIIIVGNTQCCNDINKKIKEAGEQCKQDFCLNHFKMYNIVTKIAMEFSLLFMYVLKHF